MSSDVRLGLGLVPAIVCLWLACTLHGQAWDDVDGPAGGEPESIGRYAAGCVIGAAGLPPNGPGYQAVDIEREPPPGDGCGPELASWLERGQLPSRAPGERRTPVLPMRCDALR